MDLKERYLTLLKSIREILKNENQMHISSIKKKMDTILDECLQLEKDISKEKEWEVGGSGLTEEDKQEINNSLLELKSKIEENSSQIDEKANQSSLKTLESRMNNFLETHELYQNNYIARIKEKVKCGELISDEQKEENGYMCSEWSYTDSGDNCITYLLPHKLIEIEKIRLYIQFSNTVNPFVGVGTQFNWNYMIKKSLPIGEEFILEFDPNDIPNHNENSECKIYIGTNPGKYVNCKIKYEYNLISDRKLYSDYSKIANVSEYSQKAETSDYAEISSRTSISDNAGVLFLDDITSKNVVATIKKDGNSFSIEKESGTDSSKYWYGFYIGINYKTIEELDTYFNLNLLQNIDNGYSEVSDIRIVKSPSDWSPTNYPILITSIAKEDKFNIYDIIKFSNYFDNYSELNKLYIGIYYSAGVNSIDVAIESKIKWNITPIKEIKNSYVIASDITEILQSELIKKDTEELKRNINKIPIGFERVSIDNYSVRDIVPTNGIKNLVAISQKGKYINVKKESTQVGTKYCGVYIKFRYNKFEDLDGNLLVEVKKYNGADIDESHILYNISDWGGGNNGNISLPINKKFNLKALLDKDGYNYNERNVLYLAVLKYSPNGVSDTVDFDIEVTFEPNNKEDVIATGVSDSLMNKIIDTLNNSGIEEYITCWGDSLTAGGGWTTTLSDLLGLPVYNGGTGGENSKTIMARQGADVMMVNNLTIPSEITPVTIASRETDGGITTFFGNKVTPLLQGGAHVNPCYIGNIKGTLKWTGSAYNDITGTWTFTREEIGEEIVINRPTAIRTDFDINKNSPRIMVIFMGQNGGYDNIEHLIQQHRLMIEHSKCKDFIVLGLSSDTESQRMEYEQSMKNEFGRRFISLREYLSKYGLEDAGIEATTEDIEMMAEGKTPKSLLSDNVHYNAICKTVIGKMLAKKIKELGMI